MPTAFGTGGLVLLRSIKFFQRTSEFLIAYWAMNIHFELALLWRIANSCTSWRVNYEWL